MAVLTNPTLDQLRHIKEQNLENLFAEVTVPGAPRLSRVFGVGIGPATTGNGRSVEIETTGTNTIVLLLDEARLEPGDVPPLLTGIDVDGSEISVVPALVPSGTWRVNPFDRTSNPAPVQPQHFDMDQELDQPDPESPSGRLVIGDRAERSQLIGGLHVGVSYDIVRARRPLCEAIKTTEGFGGTLGCIAETTDTHKFVALTCHHVVIQGGSVFTTTTDAQGNETGKETLGDYQLVKRDDRYVLQVRPLGTASYFDASTKRVWGMTNGMRSDDFVVGHPTPGNACELARDEIGRFYRSQLTEQVDAAAIVLEESQTECCLLPRFLDGDLTDWRAETLGPDGSDDEAETIAIAGAVPADLTLNQLQEPFTRPDNTTGHRLTYLVRKYGFATGRTSGLVRCIEMTRNPNRPEVRTVPSATGSTCAEITLPVAPAFRRSERSG